MLAWGGGNIGMTGCQVDDVIANSKKQVLVARSMKVGFIFPAVS